VIINKDEKYMKYFTKIIIFIAFVFCSMPIHSQVLYLYSDLPDTKIEIKDSVYTVYSYQYYQEANRWDPKIKISKETTFLNIKIFQNDILLNDTTIEYNGYKMRNLHIDTLGNFKLYRNFKLYPSKAELKYQKFHKFQKNSINALISIPEINIYSFDVENGNRETKAGFLGLGLGIEFFYKDNKSLQLRGDGIWSFIAPIPASYHPKYSSWKTCGAWNINLTDNFSLKRFQLGYGLNYAINIWNARGYYNKPPEELEDGEQAEYIEGVREVNHALGLSLQANFRLGKFSYIGVIYRPSFFRLSAPKFIYEHSISIEFLMKFGK
jgi:hypothetical protein